MPTHGGLGLRKPTDDRHHQKFPLRATLKARGVMSAPSHVERRLDVNTSWRHLINQHEEGACVGAALTFLTAIINRRVCNLWWLYRRAQEIDEFPDTPPADGTSLRAGGEVLRLEGHSPLRMVDGVARPGGPSLDYRIETYRWTTDVDELRAAVALGLPFALALPWFESFDAPAEVKRWLGLGRSEWFIGRGALGPLRGFHAVCGYGARDSVDAFPFVNSWGVERVQRGRIVDGYPLCHLPYELLRRLLLAGDAEAMIVTDYVPAPPDA